VAQEVECLFCRIVAGEIPADVVRSAPRSIAFRDIDPQAPTHVLVIPRDHHDSVGALVSDDPELAADLLAEATEVARQEGLTDFRMVTNTGAMAGQSVFHVHFHVLGGRTLTWPPG
jgi:histidine triad (HIT) family protein